jgi:hypothetical protein
VRAESAVGGESERLKTIQEHVNPRTFSAESAEKIRHPREFQSCMGSLRCRAEGFATRPTRPSFNRAWVHSGAARKGSPPALVTTLRGRIVLRAGFLDLLDAL